MAKRGVVAAESRTDVAWKVANAILGFIGDIPRSAQSSSRTPEHNARNVANGAAVKAATAAGTLSLPPGPLGWLTILPEMVADIAALYGKTATLTQEQMLYCLFKHCAAQAVRDLVVRVGERVLIKRPSLRVIESVAQRVGVRVTQRAIGKGLSRWLPIVGALGVAAYAYYDTGQVAGTAIELFEREIELDGSSTKVAQ